MNKFIVITSGFLGFLGLNYINFRITELSSFHDRLLYGLIDCFSYLCILILDHFSLDGLLSGLLSLRLLNNHETVQDFLNLSDFFLLFFFIFLEIFFCFCGIIINYIYCFHNLNKSY